LDIFFIDNKTIKYVSYIESQDLLYLAVEADFHQFEGTAIIIDSVTYNVDNFKLPQREWVEVFLICNAYHAEGYVRGLNRVEAHEEINRHEVLVGSSI
jgi:hypothetical protein